MDDQTLAYSPSLPWESRADDGDFGRDLSCVFDLRNDLGAATGRQLLAEALARRIITIPGTLLGEPDYGYDLPGILNSRIDAPTLAAAAAAITGQWRQDDRVLDASIEISFVGGVLIVAAMVTTKLGPFPLTISVDEYRATILKAG